MADYILLPRGSKPVKDKTNYSSKEKSRILGGAIEELSLEWETLNWQKQVDLLVQKLVELTKSQGAYYSCIDFDTTLKGLIVKTLLYSNHGNKKDIYIRSIERDTYFPMNSNLLHFTSVVEKKILISNDVELMGLHQCPGVKIHNIMYIPVLENDVCRGLFCLINRKSKYSIELAKYISPLITYAHGINFDEPENKEKNEKNIKNIKNTDDTESTSSNTDHLTSYIVHNMKEISIVYDVNKNIVSFSHEGFAELKSLFGISLERNADLLEIVSISSSLYEALKRGIQRTLRGEEHTKIEHIKKDERTIYFDVTYAPIYENKDIVGGYIIAKNITRTVEMRNELLLADKMVTEANHKKDNYLSKISHELRTPLNVIMGYAQLLESEYDPEYVKEILKGGKNLVSLIDNILGIVRLNSGRLKLSMEPLDVLVLINKCKDKLLNQMNEKNLIFNNIHNMKSILIFGDAYRTEQIITNVMQNAIDYNVPGGKILINSYIRDDYAVIKIIDTGNGIKESDKDKLFQEFVKFGGSRGTGLGLVICKNIIEAMGGSISIDSEYEIGTEVMLKFKIHQGEEPVISNNDSVKNTKQKTILHIEDNVFNYKLMQKIVDRIGCIKLINVNLGKRGLEIALETRPDLIILDLGLPDIEGDVLIENIKKSDKLSSVPILACSAYLYGSYVRYITSKGVDDFISKPINVDLIQDKIRKLLNIAK